MDSKTPAQIAEDEERRARVTLTDASITRALAARAWATAEGMIDLAAFDATPAHGPEARLKAERDRLRREFEEASK